MVEQSLSSHLSEQEYKARQELFRYTDLTHPVMQILFKLQCNEPKNPAQK